MQKLDAAENARVRIKLNDQEKNAIDYFNGEAFYKERQHPDTEPNIFDTRESFFDKNAQS